MQIDDQSILIGLNGKNILHCLPLATSCDDEQVHMEGDGIKPTSKEIVHEHNGDILEGECSIKASPRTSNTGGQQEYSKIDACKI